MDMKKSLWLKLRQKIKRNRINPLVIFTCLFSLLCIFRLEINPLASGIDPSWIYAINFATSQTRVGQLVYFYLWALRIPFAYSRYRQSRGRADYF